MLRMRAVRSLLVIFGLGLALLLLQSCGGGEELTQDAAPTDAESTESSDVGAASTSTDQPTTSFSADVQPILEENCVSCHSNNGPGTPHLEMATAGDVASIADFIAFRVEERQMPPGRSASSPKSRSSTTSR
jgi:hypothetical protein